MKKIVILTLAVVFLSFMTLVSCKKEEQENVGIMDKIQTAMDGASSFEADSSIGLDVSFAGETMKIEEKTKLIYSKSGDDLYFYSKTDTSAKIMEVENTISYVEGFNEGQYFLSFMQDGKNRRRIRSACTESEFMEFYENYHVGESVLKNYGEISHVEEDSTHTVVLKKYNESLIRKLNGSIGFPFEDDGDKITDICVTIKTNSEFLITEINVEYVFSGSKSFGGEKMTFSGYNNAKKILNDINPGNYTLVQDAKAVMIFEKLVNDRKNLDNASLILYNEETRNILKKTETTASKYSVSYGFENGQYCFDLDAKEEDSTYNMTYENGVCKINGVERSGVSEYAAKQVVDALIDPYSFMPNYVDAQKGIEKTTDNNGTEYYTIYIRPSMTSVYEMIESTLRRYSDSEQVIEMKLEFAVKDHKLISLKYTAIGKSMIKYVNHSFEISVSSTSSASFFDEQ